MRTGRARHTVQQELKPDAAMEKIEGHREADDVDKWS